MRYQVTIGDRAYEVVVDGRKVVIDGQPVNARLTALPGTPVRSLEIGHVHRRLVVGPSTRENWRLQLDGRSRDVEVIDERTRVIREMSNVQTAGARVRSLRAPMPGLVVKVEVEEGQDVIGGQGVVIVEAMKMENELSADTAARVTRVLVAAGDTVEKGQVLVELEPADMNRGPG
jgi:biotin carboxyl carrier protein